MNLKINIYNYLLFTIGSLFFINNFIGVEVGLLTLSFFFSIANNKFILKDNILLLLMAILFITTSMSFISLETNYYLATGSLYSKYIVFLLTIYLINDLNKLNILVCGYIFGASISAIIMILNYTGILQLSIISTELDYTEIRQSALMGDPNIVGAFIVVAIMFQIKNISESFPLNISILYKTLVLILLISGLVLTFSRGAWVNLLISLAAYLIYALKNKKFRTKTIKVIFSLFLFFLIMGLFLSDHTDDLYVQIESRTDTEMYQSSIDIRKQSQEILIREFINNESIFEMAFGNGVGTSKNPSGMNPHHTIYQILNDVGIVSTLVILTLIAILIKYYIFSLKHGDLLLLLLISCYFGLMIHSLVVDLFYWKLPWLLLALIYIALKIHLGTNVKREI